MNVIALEKFNNYYNRIVKKHDTVNEYITASTRNVRISTPVAFNPADGIDAEYVINCPATIDNFSPDYFLVIDENNQDSIISRWYILEAEYIRKLQYKLILKRDVIADNYNNIVNAPALVKRATATTVNGIYTPWIFNTEPISVNQIKQSQDKLFDTSGCPWIIMYVAKNYIKEKFYCAYKDGSDYIAAPGLTDDMEIEFAYSTGAYVAWRRSGQYSDENGTYNVDNTFVYTDTIYNELSNIYKDPTRTIPWQGRYDHANRTIHINVLKDGTKNFISYYTNSGQTKILSMNLTTGNVKNCTDQSYDIIAFPYTNSKIYYGDPIVQNFTANKDEILAAVLSMAAQMGDACYDIQIVPYAPDNFAPNYLYFENNDIFINEVGGVKIGVGYYVTHSKRSFDISFAKSIGNTVLAYKKDVNCHKYRLCSPSYNAIYEFNLAQNGGSISKFVVKQTLIPFGTAINIQPNFAVLNGSNYVDGRGLNFIGGMSLSQAKDAWYNYMLNNSTYNDVFNKQIESQQVANAVADINDWTGAAASAVSGAFTGAIAGGGIGAIVGGIGGLALGAIDAAIGTSARQRQVDIAKDTFGLQMQAIKAMPYALSKVSTIYENNNLVPILEYYSCTAQEESNFEKFLYWYGMNINYYQESGIISWIIPNQKSFISAKILRLESIVDDVHMASTIAKEIETGVFI